MPDVQNVVYSVCNGELVHVTMAGCGLSSGCTCTPDECRDDMTARHGCVLTRLFHRLFRDMRCRQCDICDVAASLRSDCRYSKGRRHHRNDV